MSADNSSDTTSFVPKRRGTLLIVDDEDGPREALRIIFKDDYGVLMAGDGTTAIELAQNNPVDVAVCDIRMAGMSGIEVLERLKYVSPGIEVVMITAYETTDTMRQALRLRASDYINKPFDVATIRAAVAAAMQRRRLENEIHGDAEKVQELLSQLQDMKMEEQAAQTRGDIYASVLHDINGPLTVISGFLQILKQPLFDRSRLELEDLEFIRERHKIMTRQIENCIQISRRYLGFLRRQSDETPRIAVNQLLADLNHLLRVHPCLPPNQLNIVPLVEDITVKINGTDIIQILLNLAVNAFQCTSHGCRVEIVAEVLREPLDLTAFKDSPGERLLNVESFSNAAPLVRVSVRDNGPGIPPEVLPQIFQPRFTTKPPRQGTGLGLNIVLRLVKEAGGALHVQTRVGEGTTFTIYLPAVPAAKT